MRIANASDLFQEIGEVGVLGETGELADPVQADVDEALYARVFEKAEELLGCLSRETDRAQDNFHKIKSTR